MQKFRDNKKIKKLVNCLLLLLVVGIGIYFLKGSYSKYEVVDNFTLIEGQVPSFSKKKNLIEVIKEIGESSPVDTTCGESGVVQVSHTGVTGTTNDMSFKKQSISIVG